MLKCSGSNCVEVKWSVGLSFVEVKWYVGFRLC